MFSENPLIIARMDGKKKLIIRCTGDVIDDSKFYTVKVRASVEGVEDVIGEYHVQVKVLKRGGKENRSVKGTKYPPIFEAVEAGSKYSIPMIQKEKQGKRMLQAS